jgi:DNA-directed RNA polymerase specialized sigma24 family protein
MDQVENAKARPVVAVFADRGEVFAAFVASDGARLRRVLYAHFGAELGREATAEALAYAWEHWDRVSQMGNPVGYLYRVGQSASRRQIRWRRPAPVLNSPSFESGAIDPHVARALAKIPASQRTAVVLVHGLDWTLSDAAASMNVSVSTLRNHLRRGLDRLRNDLGDDADG